MKDLDNYAITTVIPTACVGLILISFVVGYYSGFCFLFSSLIVRNMFVDPPEFNGFIHFVFHFVIWFMPADILINYLLGNSVIFAAMLSAVFIFVGICFIILVAEIFVFYIKKRYYSIIVSAKTVTNLNDLEYKGYYIHIPTGGANNIRFYVRKDDAIQLKMRY